MFDKLTINSSHTAEGYVNREEQWKPVVGYEGWYEVSSHGRVKRIAKGKGARPGHILSPDVRYDNYRMVNLLRGSAESRILFYVHRLVVEAFISKIPDGLVVNHIDGNGGNNHVLNLEITTDDGNRKHAQRIGLIPRGAKHHMAKLTETDVVEIRRRALKETRVSIARDYGMSSSYLGEIVRREAWKHVSDPE